jgi:nucleotide-binding universal stress UspA family protein
MAATRDEDLAGLMNAPKNITSFPCSWDVLTKSIAAGDSAMDLTCERAPSAADCPGPDVVLDAVRARLGFDPFVDPARINIRVSMSRQGDELRATIHLSEAESDDADMLVMGNSQERGGSTTIATIRGSRVPVLCVPTQAVAVHKPIVDRIRHVLVTTDFSPLANAAITEAYRVIAWQGTVTLAHVAKPLSEEEAAADESDGQLATKLLGLVPSGVDAHRISSRTLVARSAVPGEAIVQATRRLGPALVVIALHGRTGLGRALRGSVAEYVLRHSPIPLLVVPPGDRNAL